MTLARLGISNRGPPLRHYDFHDQGKREWRSSDLLPFASNLAAVFFKYVHKYVLYMHRFTMRYSHYSRCSIGEYNRVMFFVNEKRVDYEGCEVGLCSWSYIRNRFLDVLQHCNLDWCNSAGSIHALPIAVFSFVFIFIYLNIIYY